MSASFNREFAKALCELLGLKHVRKLTITFEVGEPAIIEATMPPVEVAMFSDDLSPLLKKFKFEATPIEGDEQNLSVDSET